MFVERLWKSVIYEETYLHAYDSVCDAKQGSENIPELLSNVVYGESSGFLFLISILFNAVNEFDAFNDIC